MTFTSADISSFPRGSTTVKELESIRLFSGVFTFTDIKHNHALEVEVRPCNDWVSYFMGEYLGVGVCECCP